MSGCYPDQQQKEKKLGGASPVPRERKLSRRSVKARMGTTGVSTSDRRSLRPVSSLPSTVPVGLRNQGEGRGGRSRSVLCSCKGTRTQSRAWLGLFLRKAKHFHAGTGTSRQALMENSASTTVRHELGTKSQHERGIDTSPRGLGGKRAATHSP